MASIVKRPDRPLPYFVYWREHGTKAQRARAFRTKHEAEDFRDTVSTDLRHGTYTDPRPIAFKVFAEDWLARTRPTVAANTAAQNEWAVNLYRIPAFGLTPIQNLTPEQIEHWQAELLKAGNLSPRSVEICRTKLGTMLKDARMKRWLYVNPMEAVRRFDVPKRELHYLTAAQVKELCEKVGRVYGVLFLIMGFCGLRIGEALGLEWPDLNWQHRHLFIQRQVIWRRKKDCPAGETRWQLVEPKSDAGKRVVEIPGPLVRFLEAHRAEQNGVPNSLAHVFPSEDGTPLYPGNVRRRPFQPALTALGLKGIRQHDFRRAFTSMHVEAGTHPKLVQERLGHSNIKLTMDVYGKLAGKMTLGAEQTARLDAMTETAAPVLVNTRSTGHSKSAQKSLVQPERRIEVSA
jgi:integrase